MFWLVHDKGCRLRVPESGLLLGRSAECDVILDDKAASRSHALVRSGRQGPEVLALGRRPTYVDGQRVERQGVLRDGAILSVPGEQFTVLYGEGTPAAAYWGLQVHEGPLVGIRRSPFTIGRELVLPDLPPYAAIFTQIGHALFVDLGMACTLGGQPMPAGAVVELVPDQVLVLGRHVLHVRGDLPDADVLIVPSAPLQAHLRYHNVGGRLRLTLRTTEVEVELTETVARAVGMLLKRTEGVADGELLAELWPGATLPDLDAVFHRLARELVRGGVHPAAVVARLDGRTRIRLESGALVSVA